MGKEEIDVLQEILIELGKQGAKIDKLIAGSVVPVADPPVHQGDGVDWVKVMRDDNIVGMIFPLPDFDAYNYCHRAWYGYTSYGSQVRRGAELEDSRRLVKYVLSNPHIVQNAKVSQAEWELVLRYREVHDKPAKLAGLKAEFEATDESLYELHVKEILQRAIAAELHPDLFYCLVLLGPYEQWARSTVFGVPAAGNLAQYAGRDLRSLWDAEHPGQSGSPSGDTGEE